MKKINIKAINKDKIEKVVVVILLILLAIIVGKKRILTSDFYPINGDFQNYNVVRRFLDGQVPFKDFTVYLGVGHLLILSFTQLILGNNFTLSLFASNMITFLLFELMIFLIAFFIIKDKKLALWLSLIVSVINLIRSDLIVNNQYNIIIAIIRSALNYGISPGVSARLIRMAASSISICLIYIGMMFINRSKRFKDNRIIKKIYIAIISGIMTLWSNDGGISTYISISFMYFLLSIKENKKKIGLIIRDVFMYIAVSIASFFIALLIITRGNILSWFEFTFSVSKYQRWYFNEALTKFNMSLYDLDFNLLNILVILIGIYYIYKLFKEKESTMNYFYINIIIFSTVISTYLYQILSGGIIVEYSALVLLAIVVAYTGKIILRIFNKKTIINNIIKLILFIIICSTMIIYYWQFVFEARKSVREDTIYIQELGGFFEEYGDSINLAKDKIGNSKIFSTYASAVEVVTNQYQPTGTDYIIHCLGEDKRKEYMEVFEKGEFEYVATVDRDCHEYIGWIRNANWFFYKELYKEYRPVFATEYNVFYEKKNNEEIEDSIPKVKTEINKQNDFSYKIRFETEDRNLNGVFGIKVNYNCNYKQNFFKTLNFNKYVYIYDITLNKIYPNKKNNYNIPDNSNEYEIPLTVINGVGEIAIISFPNDNTILDINNIEISSFSDVEFEYCVASSEKPIDNNTIFVDNTELNRIILNEAKTIDIDGKVANIKLYKENTEYIEITLDKDAADYAYPNFFKVIE